MLSSNMPKQFKILLLQVFVIWFGPNAFIRSGAHDEHKPVLHVQFSQHNECKWEPGHSVTVFALELTFTTKQYQVYLKVMIFCKQHSSSCAL
jgi:hypothetical protein